MRGSILSPRSGASPFNYPNSTHYSEDTLCLLQPPNLPHEQVSNPLFYNILSNAYSRLMNTDKDKWDLYMNFQQQDLQQEYAFYRGIGKLLMRIAKKPTVVEYYRPHYGNKALIHNVAVEYRKHAAAVRAHFKDPSQFPMPAPFKMPEPEEDRWELVRRDGPARPGPRPRDTAHALDG